MDKAIYGLFEQREKWLESCIRKHGDPKREPTEQLRDFALANTTYMSTSSSYDAVLWQNEIPVGLYSERYAPGGLACLAYDYIPDELPEGFNRHLLNVDTLYIPVMAMADD